MKVHRKWALRAAWQGLGYSAKTFVYKIIGWFIVPFLYKYRRVPLETMMREHPRLMPWVNPEDWTSGWRGFPATYDCIPKDLQDTFSGRFGWWRYHALRNGAKGLRLKPKYSLTLDADSIRTIVSTVTIQVYSDWWIFKYLTPRPGSVWWFAACQDGHYGFRRLRYFRAFGKLRYMETKLGWRIFPTDKNGPIKDSGRWRHGATATFQPFKFGVAGSDYE